MSHYNANFKKIECNKSGNSAVRTPPVSEPAALLACLSPSQQ